jgi:hyperosmotically inducible protein
MIPNILSRLLMAGVVVSAAGLASAKAPSNAPIPRSDEAIAKQVRHEILTYPYYGIFDDVSYQVSNGSVRLSGAVTEPWKKDALQKSIQRIPGVTSMTNSLEVLPLSPMDNRLRWQLARAIYSDPALSRYATQAIPPIHIIVDNGHVTLEGVVNNDLEKEVAGLRASRAGLSFGPVLNNLRVENPAPKKG